MLEISLNNNNDSYNCKITYNNNNNNVSPNGINNNIEFAKKKKNTKRNKK